MGLLDRRRLALGRRALLELVLLRSKRRLLPLLARLVRRGRTARLRLPFPLPPEVKVKEPGKSRPDGTTPFESWGVPGSALEAVAGDR